LEFSEIEQAGDCADSYTIVRTWTATDNCGNSAVATQTINVGDDTDPILSGVPANETVECGQIPGAPTNVTATDNCDNDVNLEFSEIEQAGNCADNYTIVRTWTATDNCGNSTVATQTIEVGDNTDPIISGVPANETVECGQIPTAPANVTASDNCDDNVDLTFDEVEQAGDCADSYTIVRTWTATDNCGNSTVATQTIEVGDNTDPIIAGVPANENVECGQTPTAVTPQVSDNCDADVTLTMNEETIAGSCADNYTIIRTWTATDNCGNSAVATQTINVGDNTDPILSGVPGNETVECGQIPSAPTTVTATDNCDDNVNIEFDEVEQAGNCEGTSTIIRTWTATDDCGNSAVATQTIEVGDNTAPILTNVPQNASAECGEDPTSQEPTASDNCDPNVEIELTESTIPGSCEDAYTLVRTWTATDDCGNSAVATQNITFGDNTDPVLVGVPGDITVECGTIVSDAPTVTATDNCDDIVQVSFDEVQQGGSCEGAYILIRTWTATDNCGNEVSAQQTITVDDTTPPTITGVPNDETIECGEQPAPATGVIAIDNCDRDVQVEVEDVINGQTDCASSYTITRIFTATDDCGNESTDSQTITVNGDDTPPTILGVPANETVECDQIPLAATGVTATDNCDPNVEVIVDEITQAGACGGTYTIIRTWTAIDECGNEATATQTINVEDTTPPVLSNVASGKDVECGETPELIEPTASDNCDDDVTITMSEITTPGGCLSNYTITRTWTATDDCGNSAVAIQTINVGDTQAPTLVGVPGNETLECGEQPSVPANVTATDNCDDNVNITFDEHQIDGNCDGAYQLIRTWIATDDCGNSTSATQTIDVGDNTAPIFTNAPGNITVECGSIPEITDVIANDACDSDVDVTFDEQTISGNCEHNYQIIRSWIATDDCGNSTTASQTITVEDNTAPILIDVPGNLTVTLANGETIPTPANVTATDNCDPNVNVTFDETSTQGCTYTITRLWTAVDDCGNEATATQTITVIGELTVSIEGGNELCAGASLALTALPSGAQYTYSWTATGGSFDNASAGATNYTMMMPGTYTITIDVSSVDGCTGSASIDVTVVDAPEVTASNNGPICEGGSVTLSASNGANSYSWTGPNTFSSNEQNPTLNNVTEGGTYTVTADYGSGCNSTASTTVEIDDILQATITSNSPVCEGAPIELTASAGTSYSWTGPNGFTASSQTASIASADQVLHAGTYSVTVTNGSNCTSVASIDVTIIRVPTPTVSSNGPVCEGSTLELYAAGGSNYSWTGPNGFNSNEQNPTIDNVSLATSGTYTLEVMIDGCAKSVDIDVEVTEGIQLVLNPEEKTACIGETVVLNANGGSASAQYIWTGPNGFMQIGQQATITNISLDMAGDYTINVTDGTCNITESVYVTVEDCGPCEADAWLEYTSPENCDDENGTAVLAPSEYTYDWSDGNNGSVRNDLANGTYTVTVTDTEGCTEVIDVVIEEVGNCNGCVIPVVQNTVVTEAQCGEATGSITFNMAGNAADYTYTWVPNTGTSNSVGNARTGLMAGIYEVIISDNNADDCTNTLMITVGNVDGPTVSDVNITPATCGQSNGSASIIPSNLMYMWTFDGATGASRSDLAAGTYEVAVMDPAVPECPTVISVVIPEEGALDAEATVNSQPSCGESNGSVTINVTGNTAGASYSWNDGGTGATRNDLAAGTYMVEVETTSGCTSVVMFTLMNNVTGAEVNVPAEISVSCVGATDGTVTYNVTPETGFAVPATEVIVDQNGVVYTNGTLGAGYYCVVVTDANGCIAGEGCFEVVEPDAIVLDVSSQNTGCTDSGSIMLDVSGGSGSYTYDWSDLNGTDNIEDRGSLPMGTYSVTVTDTEGCTASASVTIGTDCSTGCDTPSVTTDVADATCNASDGSIVFTGAGNYTYTWSPAVSNNSSASNLAAGTYSVTIADASDAACSIVEIVVVGSSNGPEATGSTTAATCNEGGTATLSPATYTYTWSNGFVGASQTGLASGDYQVTVDDGTCMNMITVTIADDCMGTGCTPPVITGVDVIDANCGTSSGGATVQVSTIGNYTYTWSLGMSSSETIENLAAGTFTVTVANANDPSCNDVATFVISNTDGPTASVESSTPSTCDEGGAITLAPATNTYNWSDGGTGATRTDIAAGMYQVTVSDGSGCQDILEVEIMDGCDSTPGCQATAGTIGTTDNTEVCVNDGEADLINVTLSGATGNTAWVITDQAGNIIALPTSSPFDFEGTPAGICLIWNIAYEGMLTGVEVGANASDIEGCYELSNALTVTRTEDCNTGGGDCDATISTSALNSQCGENNGGAVITITGNGDYSILWSTGETTMGVSGLDAGTYGFTITDNNLVDCTYEDAVSISDEGGPSVTVDSETDAACDIANGGATLLPATLNYSWADGSTDNVRTDLAAGTYYVSATDNDNDCLTIVKVTIDEDCESGCNGSYSEVTVGCEDNGQGYACLEIPHLAYEDYAIFTDGEVYDGPTLACQFDTVMNYDYQVMLGNGFSGPYEMIDWKVNGQSYTGQFQDVTELVDLMNQWDTTGEWMLVQDQERIIGGNPSTAYGDMHIDQLAALNSEITMGINTGFIAMGTAIGPFDEGTHEILITEPGATCPDTLLLTVLCTQFSPVQDSMIVTTAIETPIEVCVDWDADELGNLASVTSCEDPAAGTLTMIDGTPCVTFTPDASLQAGDEVEMCVEFCNADGDCYNTIVVVVITPECMNGMDIFSDDSVTIETEDCEAGAAYCVDMDYLDILSYTLTDNGSLYDTYQGCSFDSLFAYSYISIPNQADNGPYTLDMWMVNGETLTGAFNDLAELVSLMNQLDPVGNWMLDSSMNSITGGHAPNTYGDLHVTETNSGMIGMVNLNAMYVPFGAELALSEGLHELIITENASGCKDTLYITVECAGSTDDPNTIEETIIVGTTDTLCLELFGIGAIEEVNNLCEDASTGNVSYEMIDGTPCLEYTGLTVGIDTICLEVCGTAGCDTTTIIIDVLPKNTPIPDTIEVILTVGTDSTLCLNTSLTGMPSVSNECEADGTGNADFTIGGCESDFANDTCDSDYCLNVNGLEVGDDVACIVFCDDQGNCDTTVYYIVIMPVDGSFPPTAVNDDSMTVVNTPVDVNIIINDTLNSETITVDIITDPANGTVTINDDNTVEYMPNPEFCGTIDTFTYMITTPDGSDIATVYIDVLCEEVTVFNGLSPNGDGINDTFQVLGIERFNDNTVCIFNRWGNQVYLKKGYTNEDGWDGTWNGKDLPDGTYFYVIDDGQGGKYSGYVQIHR